MDINGLGSSYMNSYASMMINNSKDAQMEAAAVKGELNALTKESTDEELMQACESFEAYLINQVFKEMKQSVTAINGEEENDYMKIFGDNIYEEYSNQAAQTHSLGIAQMLFDSIKRQEG